MNITTAIEQSFRSIPRVEGPIPVTETSHPFCAMQYSRKPLYLKDWGYVEEEFFLSGTANVYEADENDAPVLYREKLPYKNRILVRRPEREENFSGRVYVDILNATQGYDIEDLWHRNYQWCMRNGHGYVGITSKPVNVMSLKNFDYDRYQSLNWSNGRLMEAPVLTRSATIPGTEEGLFWDMLGQLGSLLRSREGSPCFGGWKVTYIYLTGQSQSGAYLNTFINYFDRYNKGPGGKPLFDGYFNMVGALVQRSIRQAETVGNLQLLPRHMHPSRTPYICLSSEADLYLFSLFMEGNLFQVKIENRDTDDEKCRYYEIPGAPHTDIACPVLTAESEIAKTGAKMPNLDPKLLEHIDDIPVEYYICGLLEKLHIWASEGIAPETIEPMRRLENDLERDEHGNALGGLRTPYVDVPAASYLACNPDDPEGICGKMEYFSKEKMTKLYGSRENYLRRFAGYVWRQAKEGWIEKHDAVEMVEWSEKAAQINF